MGRDYNESMENLRKSQRNARNRCYARNRRSTPESSNQRLASSTMADDTEDWSKFQSCLSLLSIDSTLSPISPHSPKKGIICNFISSHHPEVNRLSDVYVPPAQRTDLPASSDQKYEALHENFRLNIALLISGFMIAFLLLHSFPKK